jgi:hypothetical protein
MFLTRSRAVPIAVRPEGLPVEMYLSVPLPLNHPYSVM